MKTNIYTTKKGFSLLEITCVLIIMSVLVSAVIPVLTRSFLEKAGEKVSLDISAIQDAARAYYIAKNAWPTSITPTGTTPPTDLESNGYLPAAWNAINPFGYAYSLSFNGSLFTVSTQVANTSQVAISNRLPISSFTGNIVSSSIPPPGQSGNFGFGQASPLSAGTIYYATTDGFVVGNTHTVAQGDGFAVITDSNPTPVYVAQRAQVIWYSGGQDTYLPITYPIKKGNYYEVIGYNFVGAVSNSQVQTLNFIPINS